MLLPRRHKMKAIRIIFGLLTIYMICEYFVYYMMQLGCSYPILKESSEGVDPVYAMVIADTHLLGSREGHWFDKWRREWQMQQSFQTAMVLHQPEIVFVLGDLFDEGKWCSDSEFNDYVETFKYIFRVPESTKMYVVAGNHDIGFHYSSTKNLNKRFERLLQTPPVEFVTIRGNHFVLINSIAMEGDGCSLCDEAVNEIDKIADVLRCTSGSVLCKGKNKLNSYSRPIIMQHYPLYRESDSVCTETDSAPEPERHHKFRERWECLSREATDHLVEALSPRAVFGAHTHHACLLRHTFQPTHQHKMEFVEYTVPSFSHRNRPDPKYYLLTITPDEVKTSKCAIPTENLIKMLAVSLIVIHILIIVLIEYRIEIKHKGFYKRA